MHTQTHTRTDAHTHTDTHTCAHTHTHTHALNLIHLICHVYLSIYLSIYGIYIAPLQGNYSEALSGPGENVSFKELVKRAGQIPRKRADFRWETIPRRGTHN